MEQMYRYVIATIISIEYKLENFLDRSIVTFWDINNQVNFKRRNILYNHIFRSFNIGGS